MLSIPCPILQYYLKLTGYMLHVVRGSTFSPRHAQLYNSQVVSVCPFVFDISNLCFIALFIYSTSNLYNEKLNKFLCFNFYDFNTFTSSIVWTILYSIDANLKNIGLCFFTLTLYNIVINT